ncbi:LysE family translocator [Corynebacterium senegalense]|uniref:LysE family translocator n=1 Tax=Corynebacterium senegalense TaxID=2080750 RepID=UPI000E1FF435|nr:LysE family transporter [Corynebacterium senegalense]
MLVAADVLSWAAVMAIPGPDIVAIGSQVARHGHRAGFATALGAALGVSLWSVLSLVGISALLLAVPALAVILPVLGSAVLILLGLLALRGAARPAGGGGVRYVGEASAPDRASAWRSVRLGLVTNLSNPKALVFFTSFFTPLMNHYDGAAAKAAMLALLLAVSLLIFSTMSVVLKAASSSPLANLPAVRFLPGAIFVLIGSYYLADALGV